MIVIAIYHDNVIYHKKGHISRYIISVVFRDIWVPGTPHSTELARPAVYNLKNNSFVVKIIIWSSLFTILRLLANPRELEVIKYQILAQWIEDQWLVIGVGLVGGGSEMSSYAWYSTFATIPKKLHTIPQHVCTSWYFGKISWYFEITILLWNYCIT